MRTNQLLITAVLSVSSLASASEPGPTPAPPIEKHSVQLPPTLSAKETARQKKLGKAAARAAGDGNFGYDENDDEPSALRKRKIPQPPDDRSKYQEWRSQLTASQAKRLDKFCEEYGGTVTDACDGIGPFSIPRPPSLVAPVPRDTDPPTGELTHKEWEVSLTVAQHEYYEDYCQMGDEDRGYSQLCGGTPLVISFGDERVAYTAASASDATDWPTSATPWLVMDRDGDGAIAAAEMFGDATPLASGAMANNGFQPLLELDANGDGVLDARDPMFARLSLWTDTNGDRRSSPDELSPLSTRVQSISLSYAREAHCDARRNCEGERAAMTWRSPDGAVHTGSVIDVYLSWR
ncbi:MAG TPA: hypothetical protein VGM90_17045 [Kofleriaceae bacterium]|jgi:hypothetical protein